MHVRFGRVNPSEISRKILVLPIRGSLEGGKGGDGRGW